MTPQHQIVKIESVKVWVTRLPSLSHPPLSMWRRRVTFLPPKNASASWGGPGSRWLTLIKWQVSYIQYLLACQKSQRSTPYNIVKYGLPWKRVFRRRHLGRRVTAVTCLRWPTVLSDHRDEADQIVLFDIQWDIAWKQLTNQFSALISWGKLRLISVYIMELFNHRLPFAFLPSVTLPGL